MWLIGIVVGALVTLILTAMFNEWMKFAIVSFFSVISPNKERKIKGKWFVPYEFNENAIIENNTATIEIKEFLGTAIGRIVAHSKSSIEVRKVEDDHQVMVHGRITGDNYFTGTWFSPIKKSIEHGAFQMKLSPDGYYMNGMRIGIDKYGKLISEEWQWSSPHAHVDISSTGNVSAGS